MGWSMSVKSFGSLLIIMGVLLAISLYIIFQNPNWDVMTNLAYTALFEISPENGSPTYIATTPAKNITLGQGLIFPLVIVCIGLIFYLEIFNSKSALQRFHTVFKRW